MILLKRFNSVIILAFAIAFAVSCSTDDEVFEQEEPQTQLTNETVDSLISNIENNQSTPANQDFEDKINWFESLSNTSSYCGVEVAVLAYELFDADNNSLNIIDITVWISQTGQSIEDVAVELKQQAEQEFNTEVQLIFVAGLLVKPIDENSYEVAEISNYATFSDYFDDCQSPDVEFEVSEGTFDFNIPMPDADEVVFPDDEVDDESCVTLDFPVDIVVADENDFSATYQISVEEAAFIDYLTGNIAGVVFIDFAYPVNLITNEGEELQANSQSELLQILNESCDQ